MTTDAQWLSPPEVLDRLEHLLAQQDHFKDPGAGTPFSARLVGGGIQLDAGDAPRVVREDEALRFIRRYQSLDRPHVADFHRDTLNGRYLFALVTAALETDLKKAAQASDVKRGSPKGSPKKRKAKRPRL